MCAFASRPCPLSVCVRPPAPQKFGKKKKIMVFMSSCSAVKYHAELLNYIDIPVLDIHGKQKQAKRTSTFNEFCKAEVCVCCVCLCSSSCMFARGLVHGKLCLCMNAACV